MSSKFQEDNSSLKGQKEQLIENGVLKENISVEVGSAANEIKNRPIFQILINQKLQEGDVLMVTKIDRCSRNTLEFLKLQDILFRRKIDFISLDLPHSDDPAINRLIATTLSSIAEYLFQLGFNSYQESGKLAKPIKEPILVNSKNQFEVCFVADNLYQSRTLSHFSGSKATRFYFFVKEEIKVK